MVNAFTDTKTCRYATRPSQGDYEFSCCWSKSYRCNLSRRQIVFMGRDRWGETIASEAKYDPADPKLPPQNNIKDHRLVKNDSESGSIRNII